MMIRRLCAGVLAAGCLLLLVGTPAYAQPPVTTTTTEKNVVDTFVDVLPTSCPFDGPLYTITTTSNLITHETLFDDGRLHATFTQTGTFVAEPLDPSLPSYTGKFTVWGGFNVNKKTVSGTFTITIHGTGSDGSTLKFHETDHINVRPDGTVHEFFRCHV